MISLFLQILFLTFLISGCVGGSGAGGGLSGMDGSGVGGDLGGGQGQPTNEGVSDVEPGTPVECEKNPNHADCKELGLTAPGGEEPDPKPPGGPGDLTL